MLAYKNIKPFILQWVCSLLLGIVLPIQAMAAQGWFVGVGLGRLHARADHTLSATPSPNSAWPDDLYVPKSWSHTTDYTLFLGRQWLRHTAWFPSYRLSLVYHYVAPTLKGVIDVASQPEFEDFNYRYKLKQQVMVVRFKAAICRWHELMPFVLAGIGVAVNHVNHFTSTPTGNLNRQFVFNSATKVGLATQVGGGLDLQISPHVTLSTGYEYRYTGHIKTGRGQEALQGHRLSNKLSAHVWNLELTYFINPTQN